MYTIDPPATQIDRHHVIPVRRARASNAKPPADPRIADEAIEPAEQRCGLMHQRRTPLRIRDIADEHMRFAALFGNEVGGDARSISVDVGAHHARPVPGGEDCDRATIPHGRIWQWNRLGAGADHKDALAGEGLGQGGGHATTLDDERPPAKRGQSARRGAA